MLNIRIKSESLVEREYVHFMYDNTPYTFTRAWKQFDDKIVLDALKKESHNFECRENIKIVKEVPKEETVMVESGSIEEKQKTDIVKNIKKTPKTKKNFF